MTEINPNLIDLFSFENFEHCIPSSAVDIVKRFSHQYFIKEVDSDVVIKRVYELLEIPEDKN